MQSKAAVFSFGEHTHLLLLTPIRYPPPHYEWEISPRQAGVLFDGVFRLHFGESTNHSAYLPATGNSRTLGKPQIS